MPPFGRKVSDEKALAILEEWVLQLPSVRDQP
jgi:hypothetical protein